MILRRDGVLPLIKRIIFEFKDAASTVLDRKVVSVTHLHYSESAIPVFFEQFENPTVSIVIPVHNEWKHTISCLTSLALTSRNISYEIIIVDDSSEDETRSIEFSVQNITVLRNESFEGFFNCCNKAAQKARGKYIIFLNNYINVQYNWLQRLVDTADLDETIGMIGSKVISEKGKLIDGGTIVWRDGTAAHYGLHDDPIKPEYCYKKDVDALLHHCFLVKKNLFMEIGGFDSVDSSFLFAQIDIALKIRGRGQKVVFQPKSVVILKEKNLGRINNANKSSLRRKARESLIKKWGNEFNSNFMERNQGTFHARDRSGTKKTMVIIDHKIPTFDQDAGSRTMYQYITMFLEFGFNVKFIPYNYQKLEPYASDLENMGVEILYGYDYFKNNCKNVFKYFAMNGKYFDFVYLNRPDVSYPFIDSIKKHSAAKILYNGVDFHFVRLQREYEVSRDVKTLENSKMFQNMEMHLFNNSDVVLTISEFEKNLLSKMVPGKKTFVFPTFFYKDTFPLGNRNRSKDFFSRNSITFIGGFHHNPNIDGILWFVKDVYSELIKKSPGIKLNIIGSHPPEEILSLKSSSINVTGFISDDDLELYYSDTRVVIAPLRFGAGVKGKIIEAIVYGLPIVTTSIGKEGIVDADEFIYSTDTADEFCESILRVFNDEHEWNRIRKIEIKYSKKYLGYGNAVNIFKQIFGL